jgi:hypothetical protein
MSDNVVSIGAKPKKRMPEVWRKHSDALAQMRSEIDALRKRLEQERRDFRDVMKHDMDHLNNPGITRDEQKAIGLASWHLDKNVRDALTLLDRASERVSYATPNDIDCPGSEPAA